ncbi:hypothetical protein GLAREA_05068 [Glarea lozoyensis ATCC 20868]|uniref:Uncharacterized protein n=1 Tax=Glarea lozoyensis (strain ATCC 20868 / MF5171) TaxID=1116229 RepID=S3DUW6_GLAL2|nr:uncharacterized protein GLAREA_05068 [Glarea lozoyensis ATCC 20868]EPE35731.1 hypothetical protein GLAREA_05068 [Glarea lozoyensis ATCC 20868]
MQYLPLGLPFLRDISIGKSYNDWYPLLSPHSGPWTGQKSAQYALGRTVWPNTQSSSLSVDDYNAPLKKHTEDIMKAFMKPFDKGCGGQDSKPFRLWFLSYKNRSVMRSSVYDRVCNPLRECGYVMWDDEIALPDEELKRRIDLLQTKTSHYSRPSYGGEEFRRSQECRSDLHQMGCSGYWAEDDLSQIQGLNIPILGAYVEKWGDPRSPKAEKS